METINNKIHDPQPSSSKQLSRWIRVIQGPILISAVTSTITFTATILLYRQLHLNDAGILTLVLAIVQVLIMVAGLGQPTLILRMYSQTSDSEFNWPRDLSVSILVSFPFILLVCILAIYTYDITTLHIILIIFAATMQIVILTESQMLNASRHYAWANILLRMPNSLLILPAIALLIFKLESEIDAVLTLYSGLTAVVAVIGLFLLNNYLPSGGQEIAWKERLNGVIFLFTQSSYSLPEQGIVAIGGGLLPSSQLAIYGAMAVILKPINLLTNVLRSILTTELIRQRDQKRSQLIIGLWVIAILAMVVTIIFGPKLMALVFTTRYTEGAILIPWLALAGLFRLVEILPRSYIIGNARQHGLRRFVLWQVLIAVVILSTGWWMIRKEGVIAIAWSMVLIQLGRYLVSSIAYRKAEVQFNEGQSS